QLIKVLAETFKVRIEMKQIGARQEAGHIGGIGPCGRPLCCSSWMTNFVSVATSAARYQDISLNPQKLAGQCAKLKCCLNFEVDTYVESVKRMPSREIALETLDSTYYHFKTDIFKREITYSTDKSMPANLVTISADRAFEVITMNKRGEKPEKLALEDNEKPKPPKEFVELVGQDSVTRFDKAKKKKRKNGNNAPQPNQPKERNKQEGGEPKQQQQRPPRPPKPNGNSSKDGGGNRQPRPDNNGQRQQPKRDNKRNDNRQPQRDGNNNRRDNGNKPSTQPSNDTPA
ncbi:regulatory iron-sulfur-containing complex subunit RicT, partial [uncultured Muribaculum sp.]